jgi:predicted Fe-Mo cluster-binding NifX family protein
MQIGIASQNFRTITGHAGKTRRFLLFTADNQGPTRETGRLDLPREQALHEFRGSEHPLFQLDVLIVGSCGPGFRQRLAAAGVQVVTTSETDPARAVTAFLAGSLPPGEAHPHHHGAGPRAAVVLEPPRS